MLQAATDEATVELPDQLVHARAHEMVEQTMYALARQGISKEAYLQIAGKDEESLAHDAEPDAASALRREAVLAAIIAAEKIEPTDEELVEALRPAAERDGSDPAELVDPAAQGGAARVAARGRRRPARPSSCSCARPSAITVDQAKAREKLWTPGKEDAEGTAEQIWTPGS